MSQGVWTDLVGQDEVVETLTGALDGGMTHAWLITGPPGSGRSNAAVAFAAALQCSQDGCGDCHDCRTVVAGSHADVTVIDTDGLSIGVAEARQVVRRAAMHPSVGTWQIIIIEDADRLTDQAANALLKAIEEPAPQTVWLLCAPSIDDVIVTIRSRCRAVLLRTPPIDAIVELLVRKDGIEADRAHVLAAAAQGHIGRARRLARDPEARERREQIIQIPRRLRGLSDGLAAARQIVTEAEERATTVCDEADARELANLQMSWGVGERGKRPTGYAGALSALAKDQKARRKRTERDSIDGVLLELMSVLRDVLTLQVGARTPLINIDARADLSELAERTTAEHTVEALDAIGDCRTALVVNAAPQLALESLMVRLLP